MKSRSKLFFLILVPFVLKFKHNFMSLFKYRKVIMPRNICPNLFSPSCNKIGFSKTSCVDSPSQKGVARRNNRHLLETVRALLFQMNEPKHFWADAVSTTCFFINRMPSSVLNRATPYHQLFPNKPLFPIDPKVVGCTCFVWDVRPQVSKLDPKSLKCIFVGYSHVQKAYRRCCPTLRRSYVY